VPVTRLRVLLSEASTLTAREHLSVLGPAGIGVDVASSSRLAIARFSRWCRRVVRVPRSADDPRAYLAVIAAALHSGRYDALLPTHEQAWPGQPRPSDSDSPHRQTRPCDHATPHGATPTGAAL